jgi:hypothetical protein
MEEKMNDLRLVGIITTAASFGVLGVICKILGISLWFAAIPTAFMIAWFMFWIILFNQWAKR